MTKQAKVYGESLYALAKEEGLSQVILTQLGQVIALFDENPDYWRFLDTVSIPKQERCKALDEALGGAVQPYLLNFIKILCENAMAAQLKGCADHYRCLYNEDHGIVQVRAITAVSMSDAVTLRLKDKLERMLGKTVELTCKVDPACMGGVLLELPGRQLDGTVRQRLDDLRQQLQTAAM